MSGSLDHWTTLFLLAAGLGYFLALVLVLSKGPDKKNQLLALLVFLFSIALTDNVVWWSGYFRDFPHMLGISMPFPFLYGPIFYLYLKEAINPGFFSIKSTWVHFVLPCITILYLSHYYLNSGVEKLEMTNVWHQNIINALVLPLLSLVSLIYYTYQSFHLIRRFQKKRRFVVLNGKNWLGQIYYAFLLFVGLFVTYHVLIPIGLASRESDYVIAFGSATFIYFIGFLGYNKSKLLNGIKVDTSKYQSTTMTAKASLQVFKKIKISMEKEKVFTDNELRLPMLAEQLSLTPHQVSQVINEHARMNFSDFINSYRVEEAKRLFDEIPKINQVAYDVGFNNKTSFNLAFKKFTGLTPTEYKNQMLLEK